MMYVCKVFINIILRECLSLPCNKFVNTIKISPFIGSVPNSIKVRERMSESNSLLI